MRRYDEILRRIRALDPSLDPFAFRVEALLPFLCYEDAKAIILEDFEETEWLKEHTPLAVGHIMDEIRACLQNAWQKCLGHRGPSALRLLQRLEEFVWLLGDDGLLARVNAAPYPQYGAPKLAVIAEALRLEVPASEPLRNMIAGKPCEPGCTSGCGV